MTFIDEGDKDQRALAALAGRLGSVAGDISRPAVRRGLIVLLAQPEGGFSRAAVGQLYSQLGDILDAVQNRMEDRDGIG
jgi:hypothetical protein